MAWSALKIAMLDTLMKWLARNLWGLAQDMVGMVATRDDLSSEDKFNLAREMLLNKVKEMNLDVCTSGINYVLEAAVQYFKYKAKK